jgi:hypothetical protein
MLAVALFMVLSGVVVLFLGAAVRATDPTEIRK